MKNEIFFNYYKDKNTLIKSYNTYKMPPKKTKKVIVDTTANDVTNASASSHDIQQLSMLEHAKIRSMWAGSKNSQSIETYVVKDEGKDKVMIQDTLQYPPSLYKILDEIIVNAMDHYIKNPKDVTLIEIATNKQNYSVSVMNNGPGIPIKLTTNLKGEEMYMPQKAFSEFLAGSNLDDTKDVGRIVGGQNGLGAKLTAAYSSYFKVETTDEASKKYYVQEFFDGLTKINPPIIQSTTRNKELTDIQKKGHTKITFIPDYKEFIVKLF
jgi:DNA topoisomerase-2